MIGGGGGGGAIGGGGVVAEGIVLGLVAVVAEVPRDGADGRRR